MAAAASPASILIVDDDRGLLRLVQSALRREGFSTATAASGQEALQWLTRQQADLLLLDLKLPDLEGRDLIQQLAQRQRSVPFVIITGQGDERVAVEMMKSGALDYLVKDGKFLEFVPTVVRRALAQLERDRKLAAAEEALRRNEARYRALLHAMPDLMFRLHRDGTYLDFHAERPQDLLVPPDQLVGMNIREVPLPPALIEQAVTAIQCALDTGQMQAQEFSVRVPTGFKDYEARVVASGPDEVVVIVRDITERKRLEKEILAISDREQCRIGQDLHDGLGQHLAGIEFLSQVLTQKLATRRQPEAQSATEIARLVREAISQTRQLARGLSPVVLESEGLMAALEELAAHTQKLFGVRISFECATPVLIDDHPVATHLFRIAQEAVSNAVKHGKPRKIGVSLKQSHDRTVLTVRDDGIGLPEPPPATNGLGLRIMQYRAGMIGATLRVQAEPGGGTSVICSWPRAAARPPGNEAQPKLKRRPARRLSRPRNVAPAREPKRTSRRKTGRAAIK